MKAALLGILMSFILSISAQNEPASRNFKYDFFAPVAGCLGFSLETWFRNSTTMEYTAGIIGVKLADYFGNDGFFGGYISAGPKIYIQTNELEGFENYSSFTGYYLKPELLLNYFNYTDTYTPHPSYVTEAYEVSSSDYSISLLLGLGRQWVIREKVTMDLWFGLGYGSNWVMTDKDQLPEENYFDGDRNFKYSYVRFGDSPMIFDGGLSIGILFQ